jgi:hypothetical protein
MLMYSEMTLSTQDGNEHPHQRVGESAHQPLADLPARTIVSYVDGYAQFPGSPVRLRNEIIGVPGDRTGERVYGHLFLHLHEQRLPWLIFSFDYETRSAPEHLTSLLAVEPLIYTHLTPINGRYHRSAISLLINREHMVDLTEAVGRPDEKGAWLFSLLVPGIWPAVFRTPINGPKHLWIALHGR